MTRDPWPSIWARSLRQGQIKFHRVATFSPFPDEGLGIVVDPISIEESEANARLMVSSRELLYLVSYYSNRYPKDPVSRVANEIVFNILGP